MFENDWRAPILMRLVVSGTSITVRFYSQRLGRRVTSWTAPHDSRSPTIRAVHNPSLPLGTRRAVKPAGSSGFTIEYGRRVYRGALLLRVERWRHRYDPEDEIIEVGTR